jgi:hypothetical protein
MLRSRIECAGKPARSYFTAIARSGSVRSPARVDHAAGSPDAEASCSSGAVEGEKPVRRADALDLLARAAPAAAGTRPPSFHHPDHHIW